MHKETGIMSFSGKWMELEIIILNKISQTQKRVNIPCSLLFEEPRPKIMRDVYKNVSYGYVLAFFLSRVIVFLLRPYINFFCGTGV
jgi:hypothetical protein